MKTLSEFLHEAQEATRANTRGRRLNPGATQKVVSREDRRREAQERRKERIHDEGEKVLSHVKAEAEAERRRKENAKKGKQALTRKRMQAAAERLGLDEESQEDYEEERIRRRRKKSNAVYKLSGLFNKEIYQ